MYSTLVTYLQIFGIGFGFGIIGPCLLTCAPVLLTYIAGSKRQWYEAFKDIITFLFGRIIAYMLLGALAGSAGTALRAFTSSSFSIYLKPLAGAVTILFAIIIFTNRRGGECPCRTGRGKIYNFSGVFAFGFLVGISPCAPLLALLFDITLMSRGVIDGMMYALFFGAGTFLSGLITIGVIAGAIAHIPASFIKSQTAMVIFRVACSILLIILGLGLMMGRV